MSNPAVQCFKFYAGDTETIELVLKDSEGSVIDISGYTLRMQIREKRTSANAILDKQALIFGVTGRVLFQFSKSDTAMLVPDSLDSVKYVYDIEMTDLQLEVRTVLRGDLHAIGDVTR